MFCSAPSVPFCFHFPGKEASEFAASFPIAYAIEDTSIRGTTIHWAHQQVGRGLTTASAPAALHQLSIHAMLMVSRLGPPGSWPACS